jgi:CO dehydrogenase maturation factor
MQKYSLFIVIVLLLLGVLAVDADINIHLADLLGLECNDTKPFSDPKTTEFIRTYLRGENLRLESTASFVKTTPPAGGSNLFTIDPRNPVIRDCTLGFAPGAFYGFVGTYTTDDIGATCYHGHLAVLENLLSHSNLSQDEWVVVDMVAGIDAFANTLHAQFDAIVLVMEPTPEGILVYKQYSNLAKEAGVLDRLVVVVNKVEGADDLKYVESQIGNVFFGQVAGTKTVLGFGRLNVGRALAQESSSITVVVSSDEPASEPILPVTRKKIVVPRHALTLLSSLRWLVHALK